MIELGSKGKMEDIWREVVHWFIKVYPKSEASEGKRNNVRCCFENVGLFWKVMREESVGLDIECYGLANEVVKRFLKLFVEQ